MKRFLLLLLTAMATVFMGCGRTPNEYSIEMKPLDDGVERRLTCWRGDASPTNANAQLSPLDTDELARLTSLYPQHFTSDGTNRHVFVGQFQGRLPADIGGYGEFRSIVTSLGSARLYFERFRGDANIAAQPEARLKAADHLVDLIIGWLATELGKEPQFAKLRRFLDADLRKDVRNLSLYFWTGQLFSHAKTAVSEEVPARCLFYLVERGYFSIADMTMFFDMEGTAGEQRFMGHLRRLIGTKLGLAEDRRPVALGFLADAQHLKKSLDQFLRTTPAYHKQLVEWKQEEEENEVYNRCIGFCAEEFKESFTTGGLIAALSADGVKVPKASSEMGSLNILLKQGRLHLRFPNVSLNKEAQALAKREPRLSGAERMKLNRFVLEAAYSRKCPKKVVRDKSSPPNPGVVLNAAAEAAFDIHSSTPDHLTVKMAGPNKPIYTNGQWDEATRQVTWKSDLGLEGESHQSLPVLCTACWALPDEKAQRSHFGETPLTESKLVGYCLWRNRLGREEAKEWEDFLRTLTPKDFKSRLKTFRFSDEFQKPESGKTGKPKSRADYARRLISPSPGD